MLRVFASVFVCAFIRGVLAVGLCPLQAVHAEVPSDATAVVHSAQPKSFDPSKSPSMPHSMVRVDGEAVNP